VLRSDWLTYAAPPATLGGSDSQTFEVPSEERATHLYAAVTFPSTAVLIETGVTLYTVRVLDAAGAVVATTERAGEGSASVLVPVAGAGPYTVEVTGDVAVSDPDTLDSDSLLNDTVTVQVAQLRAR
jgi:serine protease AprX